MGLIGWIDDAIDALKRRISGLWEAILSYYEKAKRYAEQLVAGIKKVVNYVTNNVTQFITNVTQQIHQYYQTFVTNVTQVYNRITQNVYETYKTFNTYVTNVIGTTLQDIRETIEGGPEWLLTGVVKGLKAYLDGLAEAYYKAHPEERA